MQLAMVRHWVRVPAGTLMIGHGTYQKRERCWEVDPQYGCSSSGSHAHVHSLNPQVRRVLDLLNPIRQFLARPQISSERTPSHFLTTENHSGKIPFRTRKNLNQVCLEVFILYIVQISSVIAGLDCETRKTVECAFPGVEEISHSLDRFFFPLWHAKRLWIRQVRATQSLITQSLCSTKSSAILSIYKCASLRMMKTKHLDYFSMGKNLLPNIHSTTYKIFLKTTGITCVHKQHAACL